MKALTLQVALAGELPRGLQDNGDPLIATEKLIRRVYQIFSKLLAILYQEAPDFSAETVSPYGELTLAERYLQVLF